MADRGVIIVLEVVIWEQLFRQRNYIIELIEESDYSTKVL